MSNVQGNILPSTQSTFPELLEPSTWFPGHLVLVVIKHRPNPTFHINVKSVKSIHGYVCSVTGPFPEGGNSTYLVLITNRDKITNCDTKVCSDYCGVKICYCPHFEGFKNSTQIDVKSAREYSSTCIEHVPSVIGPFPEGFHGTSLLIMISLQTRYIYILFK